MLIRDGEERAGLPCMFETPAETDLVITLREQAQPVVSLVAEVNGAVVGHVMFSPVFLSGHPGAKLMELVTPAVAPPRSVACDKAIEPVR